ncbi:two-component sensor histidine kinase [Sphingomonas zeicaulis]|uniref:PAS domain-containing sensor histidine kinase n=1 Tax=Sphingomonas zeicaulis TaxID=1632740 RepID=UPI003D25ABF9
MAARIRSHRWDRTPLGPIARWPQSLKTAVDLMLAMPRGAFIGAGRELIAIYNDAYLPVLGSKHPDALGQPSAQLFAEIWDEIGPLLDKTLAGKPQCFVDLPLTLAGRRPTGSEDDSRGFFTLEWTPLRDEAGAITGFFGTITETTRDVLARQALGESEERRGFLLSLSDALRAIEDADVIRNIACARLGQWLSADRVYYVEIDPAGAFGVVSNDYALPGLPSLSGQYPYETFRSTFDRLADGSTWIVNDVARDVVPAEHEREIFSAQKVTAWVDVPLLKAGRLHAVLCVVQTRDRLWSYPEVAVIEEVAERLWAAVARHGAQAALRQSEARLTAIVEAAPVGIAMVDTSGALIYANADAQRLIPSRRMPSRDPDLGWRWHAVYPDGSVVPADDYPGARALRGISTIPGMEFLYDDGAGRKTWITVSSVPIRDADGTITGAVSALSDIDALKQSQQALRASEKRLHMLLGELQHRVRNMLAVVRSLFARTVQSGGDLDNVADHFKGRLDSLARTQVVMTQSPNGRVNLENLIREELLSLGVTHGPEPTIEGPEVALDPATAEALGLAIHELTTNAIKYGAFRTASASLDIRWSVGPAPDGTAQLHLTWTEKDVPAVPLKPTRRGFGTELIEEALPYRLNADTRLEFRGGGICCTLTVPLHTDPVDADSSSRDAEHDR